MLAKDPDKRMGSASEVLSELQWIRFRKNFLKDAWHNADEEVRKRPFVAATSALAVVIAVVGILYFNPFSQFKAENPDASRNYTEGLGFLREYYEPENIESAIAKFNQALTFDAGYAKAWAGLGEAYCLKYENSEKGEQEWLRMAEDDCLRSVGRDSKLAAAHVCLGTVAQEKDRHKEAEEEFRTAIKFDPKADDAWRGLAQSLESQKNFVEAEKDYKEAIKLKPEYWASYTWLGWFYNNQSQYEDAIDQYEKARTLSPDNGRVLYSLGVPYFRSGRFDAAIKMFKEALAKQPLLKEAPNNLGAALFYMRDYKQAIPLLKDAARGTKYTPTGMLARAYWWDGQRDEAKKLYAQAVSYADARVTANSGDTEAHLAIAWYRIMLSDNDHALNHLRIALADHATDSHYLMIAAMVYAQMDDSQEAFEYLENAVSHGLKPFMVRAAPEFDTLRTHDPERYASLMAQK
jgi:serine/threonine-protein kinase